MKKEEERSYAILFFIASIVIIFTFAWVAWDEFYTIRPWKKYQKMYYELEVQKTRDKYNEALMAFQNPVIQKKYKDAQDKLNKAWEDFRESETQKEYKKTLAELRVLDKEELSPLKFKAMVNRNELMEQAYLYGHHKSEETRKRIKEMEAKNGELTAKINNAEKEKAKLQKRLDEFKMNIDMYTKQVNTYTEDTERYRKIMEKTSSKRPELQVHQVYLEDINMADRCMSCHVGINKNESVSEEQPYTNHPRREVYLGNHPPEKFGCILCHDGQGRANMDVEMAHGEVRYWTKPMFRGKAAQSSCIKCHDKGVELVEGGKIWKGIRLFEELGCYGCHETEGFGKDKYRMIGPDLTGISSKVSAGWLVEWLKDPKKFRPTTRMPNFMLEEDEAKAISSYLWQNSRDADLEAQGEFDEEMIEEGAYVFESVGCLACHSDEADTERTHGPNLARIGEKVNYEYLVSWLLEPKALQPRTRMPDLRLDVEDAGYLAAYMMSLRSEVSEASTEERGWLDDKELAGRGEKLISRYGCFGCHKIKGMEDKGKIGVELTEIGSKGIPFFDFGLLEKKILAGVGLKHLEENVGKARDAWIRAKLEDPRQFDKGRYRKPEERLMMPNFGLNKDEVDALAILLSGLIEEKLPEKYMAKLTEEERRLAEGKRVVDKYNCMGCHQFSIDRLYLEDGIEVNGMVKLEEEDSIFFQLWEDNEKLGRKAGETAQIKKGQIKNRIRSKGGDIAPFIIDYYVEEEGRVPEEAKVFTPPALYGEGKKVQFPWFFKFLNNPIILRPWLEVRMPTFNFHGNEASSVVGYFAKMDGQQYPYEFFKEIENKEYIEKKEKEEVEKKGKGGYLAKARNLFESKNINCASCHVRGDITPEGDPSDWAPDLSLASERLKPNWIVRWLLNPQLIQPGTKMPRFFRKGAFQEIFPGMPEEQAESIKDLLMNFPQDMLITKEPDKSVKKELSNTIEKTKES
ncbi:MAG: putative cytochrome c [Candidatus Scalindua rubra]|uniref:Putative cytochrome c n=1 Tax=Candidatus Scalindua rubra TaxID=1872076 RepID=A0A1E3X6X9_9BACT|nr:MAG: putative cytochrome c [Candidatus Scalindua rubra]